MSPDVPSLGRGAERDSSYIAGWSTEVVRIGRRAAPITVGDPVGELPSVVRGSGKAAPPLVA
jgi:hypothetical protein